MLTTWCDNRITKASTLGLLLVTACTMANVGATAPANQTQRAVYQAPMADVYRAAVQVAGEMRWGVLFSDRDAGAIRLATPQTLGAWGDTLAVNLTTVPDSGVAVLVRSTLGQSPNRRNVERYLAGIGAKLAPATP